MTPYVGEIRVFAGTFAPTGWLLCQGQTLPVSTYQLLFALLGTAYGGDGRTTFGIPNLCARVPVGRSSTPPPNMTNSYVLGAPGGQFGVALTEANLPVHSHNLAASTNTATSLSPGPALGFATATGGFTYYCADTVTANLATQMISPAGYPTPSPHNNVMPTMGLTYIIATNGIYPTSN